LRWALIAVPCLVVVGLFGADLADHSAGCGSVDPTDPANYSRVWIRNDTGSPVFVGDCEGGYCSSGFGMNLAPQDRVAVDAACGASGRDMTSWAVVTESHPTRYIAVDTPRKRDGLVFDVSKASASRTVPTPSS